MFSNDRQLYVTPDTDSTLGTLFLVYTAFGAGHYDAALPFYKHPITQIPQTPPSSSLILRCSCGINTDSQGRKSCISLPHFATCCRCCKQLQSCSSLCHCKNCANPYGIKCTTEAAAGKRKHKHRPHSLQVQVPTSKQFAGERGESLSTAIWSDFETIVLMEVISTNKEKDECDTTKLYNDTVYYSTSMFCPIPLPPGVVFGEKTTGQVEHKSETCSFSV